MNDHEKLKQANKQRDNARALKVQNNPYVGPESDIQKALDEHLESKGVEFIHIPDIVWKYIKGVYVTGNAPDVVREWFTGTFIGYPDIVAFKGGKMWSAELKNKNGKLSQQQTKKCLTMGAQVFHNSQDAIKSLDEWIDGVDS